MSSQSGVGAKRPPPNDSHSYTARQNAPNRTVKLIFALTHEKNGSGNVALRHSKQGIRTYPRNIFSPEIFPPNIFLSQTIPPPFHTEEDISPFHHHHPPIYNIKRSTVGRLGSGISTSRRGNARGNMFEGEYATL